MKILGTAVLFAMLLAVTQAHATMSYSCHFKANKTSFGVFEDGFTSVSANNRQEAEQLAIEKIKELRGSDVQIQFVECK